MNRFGKFFMVFLMTATIVSCGKKNDSGGGSSSSAAAVAPSNWYVENANDPTNVNNYNKLVTYYKGIALNKAVTKNMRIYHQGPAYGRNYVSYNLDYNVGINLSGCFLFWCASTGTNQGTSSSEMDQFLDKGQALVVDSFSANSINLRFANGVDAFDFTYEPVLFDRNDEVYKEMLNLDDTRNIRKYVITKATIIFKDGSKDQNADYIEYFYSDNTKKGFVLSKIIPMIANPVMATEKGGGYNSGEYLQGTLLFYGNKTISSIQAIAHDIQGNGSYGGFQTGTLKNIDVGNWNINQ